jgi:hypothetical protein
MLRREIEVIKNKFGIPLNQSFLSEEQQEDFQKEWKNNTLHIANKKLEHDAYSDDDSKNTYTMSAGCSGRFSQYLASFSASGIVCFSLRLADDMSFSLDFPASSHSDTLKPSINKY